MKNIVKGIIYQPHVKKTDIYGEELDVPNLVSYQHTPIRVVEKPKPYEQKYIFKSPVQTEIIAEELPAATPIILGGMRNSDNESAWNKAWEEYGSELGLKDDKAYNYLLGQILHESGGFEYMEEIADGSAYEGRKDLGNIYEGDGKKFKGRGPIQVTGRSNYEQIYNNFFVPNDLGKYDIVNNPELANDPYIGSLLSIGWLTATENGKKAITESNNYNIRELTKAINGGYNGLADRIRRTNELLNS